MAQGERFARLSSARRGRRGPSGSVLALVGLAGALLLAIALRPRPPETSPAARPTTPVRATPIPATAPSPSPSPSATPAFTAQLSEWVEVVQPTHTAPPWPTATPELPRPTPTPAGEDLSSCVEATWSAQQGLGRLGEVLVEIEFFNRCGRDLGQLEVWFEVSGYRDGSVVQSVCGHPFETVYPDRRGRVTIGLPGSLDWYDRVEVEYTGDACR